MKTKLREIGTGFGVLLPKKVVDNLRLSEGDELELTRRSGGPRGSTGTALAKLELSIVRSELVVRDPNWKKRRGWRRATALTKSVLWIRDRP